MKETNLETKYRFGIISDTQERKGQEIDETLEPLRQLENDGVKFDFIIQIGDLANTGGMFSKYAKDARRLSNCYDREKDQGELSDEVKQYETIITSPEYQEFAENIKSGGVEQDMVVYALWQAQKQGGLEQTLKDMELLINSVAVKLKDFKSGVKHIMGNTDRTFPQKFEATKKLLDEQNITSYDKPLHLPLDEATSIVFWPSMKVDENDEKQISELQKTIGQFAEQMQNKQTVLIFAHETPFKGPKKAGVYGERVKKAGLENSERVPHKQFLPISKYAMELARRLPPNAKIAMTAGHMHVPRETIEAGTQYIKFDEEDRAKMRLFGFGKEIDQKKYKLAPGGKRTIDLYYLQEGEVGTIEIKDDGSIEYHKSIK